MDVSMKERHDLVRESLENMKKRHKSRADLIENMRQEREEMKKERETSKEVNWKEQSKS